jgi:hypothetical protein
VGIAKRFLFIDVKPVRLGEKEKPFDLKIYVSISYTNLIREILVPISI